MKKPKSGHSLCCGYMTFSEWMCTACRKQSTFYGIPELPQSEFTWGAVLGQGAFGRVVEIKANKTGKSYAAKVMDTTGWASEEYQYLKEEIDMLESLNQPNIPKFYGLFHQGNDIMMLQELCEGIPLRDWMVEFQRTSTEGINEQDLVKVINVVTRTLIHVHEAGIVHCDMKPDNIIVNGDEVSLIDFGVAQKRNKNGWLSFAQGSPAYIAPEVWEGHYTEHADMWSLGVIAFECLHGRRPFDHITPDDWLRKLKSEEESESVADLVYQMLVSASAAARSFCKQLLRLHAKDRLSAEEACAHEWLHDPQPFVIPDEAVHSRSNSVIENALRPLVISKAEQMENRLIEEFKNKIYNLDQDHDYLTFDSFKMFFENFVDGTHAHWNDKDLRGIFNDLDIKKNGLVPKKEFLEWYMWHHIQHDDERFWDCLKQLDEENDGSISMDNIKNKFEGQPEIIYAFRQVFGSRTKLSIRKLATRAKKRMIDKKYSDFQKRQKKISDEEPETSSAIYHFQKITRNSRIEQSLRNIFSLSEDE